MTNYFIIIFALFFVTGYLYMVYKKLERLEQAPQEHTEDEFDFPQSDSLRIQTDKHLFEGDVLLKGYADSSPMLLLKGYLDKVPTYLYLEGEGVLRKLSYTERNESKNFKLPQLSSADIYVAAETDNSYDFFKIEEPQALKEWQKRIEGAEEIAKQLDTEAFEAGQPYQYDFQTKKIHTVGPIGQLLSLPIRWTEHLINNTINWGFLILQLSIMLGAIYFFMIESSLQHHSMPFTVKELIIVLSYGVTLSAFLLHCLFHREWIRLILSPLLALPASLMLMAPIILALYASAFEWNKKPFHAKAVALQQFSIRFIPESDTKHKGKYKPEYRLMHLKTYNSSRAWLYNASFTFKNPISPYPPKVEKYLFESARKELLKILEEKDITPCRGGCGFTTPYNRLSLVALDGYEALGQISLAQRRILKSESLCDTLPYETYRKLYASKINTKESGIMVVPIDDPRFQIGKRFAQMSGSGLAFERDAAVLRVTPNRTFASEQIDLTDPTNNPFDFTKVQTQNILRQMRELQISDQRYLSLHRFYALDKPILLDWRSVDLTHDKVIRINQIGQSSDGNILYYLVTATLSDYFPEYWYYQKKDPYLDGILAER